MAAAIETHLGVKASLVEGHNGIYEMTVGADVVYTNQGENAQGSLEEPEMVAIVARHLGQEAPEFTAEVVEGADGPWCPLPWQQGAKPEPAESSSPREGAAAGGPETGA